MLSDLRQDTFQPPRRTHIPAHWGNIHSSLLAETVSGFRNQIVETYCNIH